MLWVSTLSPCEVEPLAKVTHSQEFRGSIPVDIWKIHVNHYLTRNFLQVAGHDFCHHNFQTMHFVFWFFSTKLRTKNRKQDSTKITQNQNWHPKNVTQKTPRGRVVHSPVVENLPTVSLSNLLISKIYEDMKPPAKLSYRGQPSTINDSAGSSKIIE